jgi:hypothetical protein
MNFPNAPFQSVISEAGGKLSSIWSQWFSKLEWLVGTLVMAGKTSERPTERLWTGQRYYDSTLGQLVFWTGSRWRSAAVGYYGSFYDTTDQVAPAINTATAVKCNTFNGNWDISVQDNNKFTVVNAGNYNVQFSLQFVNPQTSEYDVDIWFRINGSNAEYSNSRFTVPKKHGSDNGHLIAALNFVTELEANGYVQIMWSTPNLGVTIETLPAGTSPTRPITPSAIVTLQQI